MTLTLTVVVKEQIFLEQKVDDPTALNHLSESHIVAPVFELDHVNHSLNHVKVANEGLVFKDRAFLFFAVVRSHLDDGLGEDLIDI